MKKFFLLPLIFSLVLFLPLDVEAQRHMEVNLTLPEPQFTTNVIQNKTFFVNATMNCTGTAGNCGNVIGTIMYNATTLEPDAKVPSTFGGTPFFVNQTPSNPTIACPGNPITFGENCNVSWTINATGSFDTNWRFGVLFNSSIGPVLHNHTDNTSLTITDCSVDFTTHWSSIDFGGLNPNSGNNSAPGNSGNEYNITVNIGGCDTDFYLNGTDLRNVTHGNISSSNLTWSNISSDPADGYFNVTNSNQPIGIDVRQGQNLTTYYWLNAPPIYAGIYNATLWITGVVRGAVGPE